MSITVQLPQGLREFTGGEATITVEGNTIEESFRDLIVKYPRLERWFGFKDGQLQTDIDMLVAVNGEHMHPIRLDMPMQPGDNIMTLLVLSGG
jgi:molybdopterin converting factor small subunit